MEQAIETDSATDVLNGIRDYARKQVEEWSAQCVRLRDWERKELLDKQPSEKTLSRHAEILRSFINNTDTMIAAAADDEIYDDTLRARLSVIRQRLQISLDLYHSSMTEEEADSI